MVLEKLEPVVIILFVAYCATSCHALKYEPKECGPYMCYNDAECVITPHNSTCNCTNEDEELLGNSTLGNSTECNTTDVMELYGNETCCYNLLYCWDVTNCVNMTSCGSETYCPEGVSCDAMTSACISNKTACFNDTIEYSCSCTEGFYGTECDQNILPEYLLDLEKVMTVSRMLQVLSNLMKSLDDLYDKTPEDLNTTVILLADVLLKIQERTNIIAKPSDDLYKLTTEFIKFPMRIIDWSEEIICDMSFSKTNCSLNKTEAQIAITNGEKSLQDMTKTMVTKISAKSHIPDITHGIIAIRFIRAKGKDLPPNIKTKYGNMALPYWETLQGFYENTVIAVSVLSYMRNPYIYIEGEQQTGIVLVDVLNNGETLKLPDPDDPVTVNADASTTLTTESGWTDMVPVLSQEGAFLATIKMNLSISAVTVDIQFSTRKSCLTYGKFGVTLPSPEDFDIMVETKGRSRIKSFFPEDISPVFSEQTLQIAINFNGKHSATNTLLLVSRCEDAYFRRRKRSLGTMPGHKVRITIINIKYFDRSSGWMPANNVKVVAGPQKNVAFKSSIFGTFSADTLFIPPGEIDFSDIFLNFLEKLEDSPFALILIICLWGILILLTLLLRKIDREDRSFWNYLPLVDNNPWNTYTYLISVSTSIRSSRKMTAMPYLDMQGSRDKTGTRVLSDGIRQNFGRGTSSHFTLTTENFLGELQTITLWHGNEGKCAKWLPSRIVVIDQTSNKTYVFNCNKWLSLDCDDGATWRRLTANDKELMQNVMFSELTKQALFDDNLWLSVSKRPHFSRFTRVQRLWTIASVLFLTMITSAMFYNTPDTNNSSLRMGPFILSYKQVYVGFLSVLITLIPNLIVITIFKRRKFREEHRNNKTKGGRKCCSNGLELPWWTIIFGYSLIVLCILTSSTFTFLYSLDWGRETTLEWLFSYFLGTLQSIFILEPFKAILLAAVLACCCGERAMKLFQELPSPAPDASILAYKLPADKLWVPENVKSPEETNESKEFKKHREKMQLEKRLYDKVRSWSQQVLYLFVLGIICAHNKVHDAYWQNSHLQTSLTPDEQITTAEQLWTWMQSKFVPVVFPKTYENGIVRPSYEQKFMTDEYHFRMGLTRIRQVRVYGSCEVPRVMNHVVKRCPVDYSSDDESKENFCKGWNPFNVSCFDENEEVDYGYLYQPSEETKATRYFGHHGVYSGGGYVVDIGPKQSLALTYVQQLQHQAFIDMQTRAMFIDTILFNTNSRLFSQIKCVFEFPPYGEIYMEIVVSTTNLYPYINSFDYLVLVIQVVFIALTFARIVLQLVEIFRTKGKCLATLIFWIIFLEIALAVAAIVFYCLRIDNTTQAIDKIGRNPGQFVSFDKIKLMDYLYTVCISGSMFLAILRLLRPLTFNYQLHILSTAINIAKLQLLMYLVLLTTLVVAFASLLFLYYGVTNANFRDLVTAIFTLYRVSIGMLKFRQDMSMEQVDGILIFLVFGICVTFVMINLFISTLNIAFMEAQEMSEKPGIYTFDKKLNLHFWEKFERILNIFGLSKTRTDNSKKYEVHNDGDLEMLIEQLEEHMVNQFLTVIYSEAELLNVCISKKPKRQDRNKLSCTPKWTGSKTHFLFCDRLSNFKLMLEFSEVLLAEEIDIRSMRIDVARQMRLYPCNDEAKPRSGIYIIDDHKLMTTALTIYKGEVEIHIIDEKLTEPGVEDDIFILARFMYNEEWKQIPAIRKKNKMLKGSSRYTISTKMDWCPTHVMAITCNQHIPSELSEKFTINRHGGKILSAINKRIRVGIPRNSIINNAEIIITWQQAYPAPKLHILSTHDIQRPIQVTIPQTGSDKTFYDNPTDFLTIVRDGCLQWRKKNLNLTKTFGTFIYNVDKIQKGVKKTVLVKVSDIQSTRKCGNKKTDEINKLIYNVSTNSEACRRWFQIGKKIGLSIDFLKCLDEDVPFCPEEKCSIVLQEWCQENKGATAGILGTVLNDAGVYISKVAVKNLLDGNFL